MRVSPFIEPQPSARTDEMILITINDTTELAIYKDLEVYAPHGKAIRQLLNLLNK